MIMKTTIATVKNEFRLTEWSARSRHRKVADLQCINGVKKTVSMLIPFT